MSLAGEIVGAYILDLFIGDPIWLFFHPVRVIGWLVENLETLLRKSVKNERLAGVILVVLVTSIVGLGSFTIIQLATVINPLLGSALSLVLIYSTLAVKDLDIETMRVYYALKKGKTCLARKELSLIVGRDTCNLDRHDIIRASIETVAENIVDGIISPFFYAFMGGAPLALVYKAVNTLDSMVGYKNEKYKNFGWAAAKTDDLLNFIPARISAILLPIAGMLVGRNGLRSWRIIRRDSKNNPSPNSGIPEAAVAGALNIQLGGVNYYGGVAYVKPFIGDNADSLSLSHIKDAVKIAYVSSALALVLGIVLWRVVQL
jgi:adenosylcobinamide-phosphate synthase